MAISFTSGFFWSVPIQTQSVSILTDVVDDASGSDTGYEMFQVICWTFFMKYGSLNPDAGTFPSPPLRSTRTVRNGDVPL